MLWACIVASATGPLVFVYDLSADSSSSRLDCDVARAILCSDSAKRRRTDETTLLSTSG